MFGEIDDLELSAEDRQRLRDAVARELTTMRDEARRAVWEQEQSQKEAEFRAALQAEYDAEIAATPKGLAGMDLRQNIRRKYRAQGFEPGAPEPGVERMRRERQEWESQQPQPTQLPTEGGGETTAGLLEDYRALTQNIPVGAAGIDARFKAMQEIRRRASEAGIQSPV